MKKLFSFLLCLGLLVVFVGCGSSRGVYRDAATAIEAGEFERALELLDTIPNYNDVDNLRGQAEVGKYINALIEFRDLAYITGVNAESLSGFVREKWDDAIRERRDFNEALRLLSSLEATIKWRTEISDYRRDLVSKYLQLGNPPEGLGRASETASALFEATDILVTLANEPSGSLNSYSTNRREAIDDFLRHYRFLGDIIDTFSE
jgi:hypothetical protein